MKSNNLIAYAIDFTSFFIQNIEDEERHEINNEISLKVGELDKWELKSSIISNSIVLYGRYRSNVTETKTKQYTLFELKIKGKRKNMMRIWRKLYGYKQKVGKKWYNTEGLIKH